MSLPGVVLASVLAATAPVVDGGVSSSAWLEGPAAQREPQPSDPPLGMDRRFLEAAEQDAGAPWPRVVRPGFDRLFHFPELPDAGPGVIVIEAADGGEGILPLSLPPLKVALPVAPGGEPSEEVVHAASGMLASRAGSGRSVEVVTTTEMYDRGARTTADALQFVPGVTVVHPAYAGGSPVIRGMTGGRVLVRVDGVRLNSPLWSAGPVRALETVDPFHVESMEVVEGPSSALHGNGAMGGVLSITERAPQPGENLLLHSEGAGYLQSADQAKALRLYGEGGLGPLAVGMGADAQDFQDLRGGRGTGPQRFTGYQVVNLEARSRVRWKKQELTAAFDASRISNAPLTFLCQDSGGSDSPDCQTVTQQYRDLAYIGVLLHPGVAAESLDFKVAYIRQGETLNRRWWAAEVSQRNEDEVKTLGTHARVTSPIFMWGPVQLRGMGGVEFYHDIVSSAFHSQSLRGDIGILDGPGRSDPTRATVPDGSSWTSMDVHSVMESTLFERVLLRSALRASLVRAKLGEKGRDRVWTMPSAMGQMLVLLGNFGTAGVGLHHGYRLPSLTDLGGRTATERGLEIGNPTLVRPEQMVTAETTLHLRAWRFEIHSSLHSSLLEDSITVRRTTLDGNDTVDGRPVWQRERAGRAVLLGGEGQLVVRLLSHGHAGAAASYVFGQHLQGEQPVVGVPSPSAVFWLDYRPPLGFHGTVLSRYVLAHERLNPLERHTTLEEPKGTPRSIMVAAGGGWQFTERSSVDLWVENLTDENYRIPGSGMRSSGANARVQLRLGF